MPVEARGAGSTGATIYFPLDQGERASHLRVDQLLPREVYESLAELLAESVPSSVVPQSSVHAFSAKRGHTAVFIDGDRGAGKTTVVVNLQSYLEASETSARHPGLATSVHILKPIDPSQLEDSDDLFLNVIVAAVLSDDEVKRAQERRPAKRQALHECLQRLGVALEGRETQKSSIGLDRLRSFMGTQALALAVHDFFVATLDLLEKRLLVLPIDDVDTTLHRAFDNLEVVRRYLSSPAVLPIVCGDLKLYREVTWRDAFRRLTKEVPGFREETKRSADQLAVEYLRKILPLQRRLQMPSIESFMRDSRILLGARSSHGTDPRLTLPQLEIWLRALLAGPVNNHENSFLQIPIPTVRALSQLLDRVRKEIPSLEVAFHGEDAPRPISDLMRRKAFLAAGETARTRRPAEADGQFEAKPGTPLQTAGLSLENWHNALLEHFKFEPEAGAVCLVLLAYRHWRDFPNLSAFATPLFAPLAGRGMRELKYVDARAMLSWKEDLKGRLPDSWLRGLPDEAIVPFATPEVGRAVKLPAQRFPRELLLNEKQRWRADLVLDLVAHRNFYSPSKRGTLLCVGRILEAVVTSLVRDVSVADVDRIRTAAPFHSAAAIAATKALDVVEGDDADATADEASEAPDFLERDLAVQELTDEIKVWRRDNRVAQLPLSPWLIYCAVNKALNQAQFFNRPLALRQQPLPIAWKDVTDTALAAFNSLWSAFASFEKGPIFGQPVELSNVNLSPSASFEMNELYLQNIRPLVDDAESASIHGEQVLSVTRALHSHPMRAMLTELREMAARFPTAPREGDQESVDGRGRLIEALGLPKELNRLSVPIVVKALRSSVTGGQSPLSHGQRIYDFIARHYPNLRELTTLQRAIESLKDSDDISR